MSLLVARYHREVLPGEIVQISKHGVQSLSVVPRSEGDPAAFCIFEYVYFARPDSIFEGWNNYYGSVFHCQSVLASCRVTHISECICLALRTPSPQGRWSTR